MNMLLLYVFAAATVSTAGIVLCGASMMALCKNWDKYSELFSDVRSARYVDRSELARGYLEKPEEDRFGLISQDPDVIVFRDDKDFKIGPDTYIHNNIVTWTDPYTLYWYFKYRDWFEENDIL